jgi:hypothetical protein
LNGICNADPELRVQLANNREPYESLVWDATGYALAHRNHIWKLVLGEDVVSPLSRGADRKCSHSNVIEAHIIYLNNYVLNSIWRMIKYTKYQGN